MYDRKDKNKEKEAGNGPSFFKQSERKEHIAGLQMAPSGGGWQVVSAVSLGLSDLSSNLCAWCEKLENATEIGYYGYRTALDYT